MDQIKADEERGFVCIDWTKEDFKIYGLETDENYSKLEAILVPCNYLHNEITMRENEFSQDCIVDPEKQF